MAGYTAATTAPQFTTIYDSHGNPYQSEIAGLGGGITAGLGIIAIGELPKAAEAAAPAIKTTDVGYGTFYTGLEVFGKDVVGKISKPDLGPLDYKTPKVEGTYNDIPASQMKNMLPTTYTDTYTLGKPTFDNIIGNIKPEYENTADVRNPFESRIQLKAVEDYAYQTNQPKLAERSVITQEAVKFTRTVELPFEKGIDILKESTEFKKLTPQSQENAIAYIRENSDILNYGSSMAKARGALDRPFGDLDIYSNKLPAKEYATGLAESIKRGGSNAEVSETAVIISGKGITIEEGNAGYKMFDVHDIKSPVPADTNLAGSGVGETQ